MEIASSFTRESDWFNDIVLGNLVPNQSWKGLPRLCQAWLRNYVALLILYFTTGALWSFSTYYLKRNASLPEGDSHMPKRQFFVEHIKLSLKAMPIYIVAACVCEWMVEMGWTRCYLRIGQVGWPMYAVHLLLYLAFVELGIYWTHRALHEIKPLYTLIHAKHHLFNKQNKVSPFTGLAVDPMDGALHSFPFLLAIFFIPTHFFSHVVLLFLECVWTTHIHSGLYAESWPLMGPRHHMLHHCRNSYNYGNYTVFMDWLFGTLHHPKEDEGKKM